MKVRAWKLDRGTWIVLVFARDARDRLTLLQELEVETEEQIQDVVRESQEKLRQVMQELGIDGGGSVEFPGAKKA